MFAPAIVSERIPSRASERTPRGLISLDTGSWKARDEGLTFIIKQGEAIGWKGYMKVHVYSRARAPAGEDKWQRAIAFRGRRFLLE